MIRRSNFGRKVICALFFTSLFCSNFVGQTPKSSTVAAKTAKAKCSGAWTGNITFTRTQTLSDNKNTKRVSNRGKDTRNWRMNYDYKASVAVLDSPDGAGANIGKASVEHKMSSIENSQADEENSCDRGKTFQSMSGTFVSRSEVKGQASHVDASVSVGVNSDGTYSVSVGIPQIEGTVSGSESAAYSGQCTKKEGFSKNLADTPTKVDGHSMTSDGHDRVDPANADQLSGSYSQSYPGGVQETISWNLKRCGGPLRITDIQFADMKYPDWNRWQEITDQVGTIDGNLVKIKAKVLNSSGETKYADLRFKETYKGDKWDAARPDAELSDSVMSVRVEPNSEETVEMVWDSSGYAWFDDGRPRLVQRIKAELEENSKKIDEMTKNLKVAPKPLVLVHGLWSNWRAWETWQNILTTSHSYDWKAFPVGEKPEKGVMNTGGGFMSEDQTGSIGDNAHQLETYIKYAQEDRNAWHVDLVAHSMGGLISRWYIDQVMTNNSEDGRPRVSHLVMLGTPNMGSPCADVMDIAFGMIGKSVEAVRQLQPDYVEGFNRVHTQRKGVKFSSLAGNPIPVMCKSIVPNDGVVSVPSAHWKIKDTGLSNSLHTDLTGTKDFSDFVKPHLAIGPKGDHNPEIPDAVLNQRTGQFFDGPFAIPTRGPQIPIEDQDENSDDKVLFRPNFAKELKLGPKEILEVDVPVVQANNFGLTFMADQSISATLIDSKGTKIGANEAKSMESRGWFRSIFFDGPTTPGIWKVRLENTGAAEYRVMLAAWANATK
ncbi:hypothetical protein BH10ACI2_BH10ACI2_08260 [soil metagenome]